ncbi:MAG: 23S rRNA (guanosine(2251)-2'-O)-methyltransferase RlmB [Bacteroidota bacterium]|nr:23S rRNA (guanosine(2251)-2'-O)-methyltransferase RlmB [Bacteroidota bacterium]|tara:strand:- start:387 stop:1124 length:738 start_codon:yes stop_codon:yes gene_type:complete
MKNNDIVFGTRPVLEAINSGKTLEKLFIQKNLKKEILEKIKSKLSNKKINISYVPKEKLNRITKKNHQGIICYISPISYQPIEEIIQRVFEKGKDPFVIILDRITDTRNFGAISRVADASGVDAIIIPEKESAIITSDSIKTSAGAINYIPICKVKSLRSTANFLKESGLKLVSCTEKGDKKFYDADLTSPCCIILGSEKDGISNSLIDISDERLNIPMKGNVESLNVSSSASVILFEVVRQRFR